MKTLQQRQKFSERTVSNSGGVQVISTGSTGTHQPLREDSDPDLEEINGNQLRVVQMKRRRSFVSSAREPKIAFKSVWNYKSLRREMSAIGEL